MSTLVMPLDTDPLAIAGVLTVLVIAGISACQYDHRGRRYALGKEAGASIAHFRFVYRYLQLTSIGIAIAAFLTDWAWLVELHDAPALTIAGLLLAHGAAALFVASKRALGAGYSPCFDAYVPAEIVTTGVYARIRHPIYTANVALLGAMFVATGSLWLALNTAILAVYYACSARAEERELGAVHAGYEGYRRRTGMFLPRLSRAGLAAPR